MRAEAAGWLAPPVLPRIWGSNPALPWQSCSGSWEGRNPAPAPQHPGTPPAYGPHLLLGVLAPPGSAHQAPTQAKAQGGDHQDPQVRGHKPDGIGDVLQVQPVEGQAAPTNGCGRAGAGAGKGSGDPRCRRPQPQAWERKAGGGLTLSPLCAGRGSASGCLRREAWGRGQPRSPAAPQPCQESPGLWAAHTMLPLLVGKLRPSQAKPGGRMGICSQEPRPGAQNRRPRPPHLGVRVGGLSAKAGPVRPPGA